MKLFRSTLGISRRIIKGILIGLVSMLVLILLLPELFPGFVSDKIKGWANESLATKLEFSKTRLSFIRHFPALTLSVYDFSLMGSKPFENDTLASGKELAFGIELTSLFKEKLNINRIYLNESNVQVKVDAKGNANYKIMKDDGKAKSTDTSSAALQIDGIRINHCKLFYEDKSIPVLIKASDLNYKGNADVSKDSFYLNSNLSIGSMDLAYDGQTYIDQKSVRASLKTSVNSNSLAVYFQKNDLQINELPLRFNGMLRFLSKGYDVDLKLSTGKVSFQKLLSVLPHSLMDWYAQTALKGDANVSVSVKGTYDAGAGVMPDLIAGLNVSNGYIKYGKSVDAVSDLQLQFRTQVPALDVSRMIVKMDTLGFRMGNDFFSNKHHSKGFNPMYVQTHLDTKMDLGKLSKAVGISSFDISGMADAELNANGWVSWRYHRAKNYTQITSIPVFKLINHWKNGYLKLKALPYALSDVHLDIQSACSKSGQGFGDLSVSMMPVKFHLAGEPFELQAKLSDFDNLHYSIKSKGSIDLSKLYAVFHPQGVKVTGYVETNLSLQGTQADAEAGNWDKIQNEGSLLMKDIRFSMYPYPRDFMLDYGLFQFNTNKIWLRDFAVAYGNNALQVEGYTEDILKYLLRGEPLKANIELRSEQFDVNDFTAGFVTNVPVDTTTIKPVEVETKSTGVIMLPVNMDVSMKANVSKVIYNDIDFNNFKGSLALKEGKLFLDDTKFSVADALFKFSGSYQVVDAKHAKFSIDVKADSFDIKKVYSQLALFRELAPAAEKASGIVSLKYQIEGDLDKDMSPNLTSLKGAGDLGLLDVKVYGLKLFSAVSKATGRDSVDNPHLSKVVIRTKISDNIISIERTKMKVFGFRPRLEGQASLDGRLNIRFRLGLPPFGILGIPMTITGTGENPIVKFRRGTDGLPLTDSTNVSEVPELQAITDSSAVLK